MVALTAGIDPDQPLPVYVQLKTLLTEDIIGGVYGPGDRLPTEHELCARYAISRTPVHRALAELAREGVILRHRRRGTFVNPHWLSQRGRADEVRVVLPEGLWADLLRDAAPTDVTLNIATVPLEDLHQVLVQAVAEGRAPDLAMLDSVWVREFAAAGFLRPLDELDPGWLAGEYLGDVMAPFRQANEYQGRVMTLQAEADVVGLWYDREALESRGLHPPTTWQELTAVCATLQLDGVAHPLALPGGSRAGEATTYCLLGMLATNGVTVFDGDRVSIDSPGTVECLSWLRSMEQSAAVPPDVVRYEHDRAVRLLAQGQAALVIGGSYELGPLAAESGVAVDEVWRRFGFVAPPSGPRRGSRTLVGGMVHGVFRQAANPHGAMAVLEALSAPEALATMSARTGQLAPRRSAAQLASAGSPFLAATGSLLEDAVVRPATPTYPRVSAQLQSMLEAVLVGRLDPEESAHRASELICAITGWPSARDADESA